ncbi:MYXO-CTERM sorting domain-containing protein [Natrialbaceae archaeon A-CW2]
MRPIPPWVASAEPKSRPIEASVTWALLALLAVVVLGRRRE